MGKYLDMIRTAERQKAERGAFVASVASVATQNSCPVTTGQPANGVQRTHLLGDKSDKSDKRVIFDQALSELESRCPDYVEAARWQRCLADAQRFLANWGDQAATLGWTVRELFGLHPVPERPAPAYCRLARYDCTGLLWLLQGRAVIALSDTTATIRTPSGGTVTYRKHRKPALGPLGDSLDDFGRAFPTLPADAPDGDRLTTRLCAQCGAGRPDDPPTVAVTTRNGETVYVHEHGCLRFWKKEHGEHGGAGDALNIPPSLDRRNEPPCDHCGLPGGAEWDYDGNKVRLHPHCEDAWLDARRSGGGGQHGVAVKKGNQAMSKAVKVTVPPDLAERCKSWAAERVAHFRSSGDKFTAMPWTRDQFSDDELRQWLASRKEAASKVDIATCEIAGWYHSMNDEYGIREMLGEQTEEQLGYSDKSKFVRAAETGGWVCETDLSPEQYAALCERIHRGQTNEPTRSTETFGADAMNQQSRSSACLDRQARRTLPCGLRHQPSLSPASQARHTSRYPRPTERHDRAARSVRRAAHLCRQPQISEGAGCRR